MSRPPDRRTPTRTPVNPRQPLRPSPTAADPALQQRAWAAALLAIISLLSMMMIGNVRRGVYVVAVALIIAVIALWLAFSVMSRARRSGSSRPRVAVFAAIFGIIGFLVSGVALIAFGMFWPQLTQYSNCLSSAGTISAQHACQQQLQNSVGNEVGLLDG